MAKLTKIGMRRNASFEPKLTLPTDAALDQNDFKRIGADSEAREEISRPSISFWQDAMRRFRKNKTAMVCCVVLVVIISFSLIVPLSSPYTLSEQHLTHTNQGMFYVADEGLETQHSHIFGTDDLGRDLWTRAWVGGRTSIGIALAAALINVLIGVTYGCIAGYVGGNVDNIMMRIVELISGIPYLLIVILLRVILPGGALTIIIAYSIVGWTGMARLARGQVVQLKNQEFIIAVQALGSNASRIILKHLIPNILSVIIVNLTLQIPNIIFTEAYLSFLGLGVPIPGASWGMLAQDGVLVFQMFPLRLMIPAILISLTMLAFNLLGDALRDAFDPKLRQ